MIIMKQSHTEEPYLPKYISEPVIWRTGEFGFRLAKKEGIIHNPQYNLTIWDYEDWFRKHGFRVEHQYENYLTSTGTMGFTIYLLAWKPSVH